MPLVCESGSAKYQALNMPYAFADIPSMSEEDLEEKRQLIRGMPGLMLVDRVGGGD